MSRVSGVKRSRPRALIVEGDSSVAALLREALTNASFQVTTATSLEVAHAVINEFVPEVVVLGLTLGGDDTEPLLNDLAEMGADAPTVVLTSTDVRRVVRLAAEYGVPYLAQPLDGDIADATMRVVAEQRICPMVRRADRTTAPLARRLG